MIVVHSTADERVQAGSIHAAAAKTCHPRARLGEAVKTNIFGSVIVADAAWLGAKAMVMISTDKAIEPVSMLG